MMNDKTREEQQAAAEKADDAAHPGVEDLVPGLEEEIARQEADADGTDQGETGDGVEAADAPEPEPDYEEIISALMAERDEFKDKWTRALAEAENVRRRAERDRRDAANYGGTRLARDLLAVYDNLERALKAADDDLRHQAASFIEGVELTQRELLNAFAKHKIEPIVPEQGDRFDPNLHQAMFEAPIPGAEPGSIIECMQSGFVIAERLLRPAMVGVARAAETPPEAAEG